jgi:Zn-dependent peptidase ImmA (M78 family)/transcriptional regulator with XRE-family HTH domain
MIEREFVGARLELARAFRPMTLKKLAETVSVSFGLLSHYENGLRKQPAVDLVEALAEALRVRPAFFFEPLSDVWREDECSFRRRIATPEAVKKRARAHGTLMGQVIRELVSVVKPPVYNVPEMKVVELEEIEAVAEQCRAHWKLGAGPIAHIGRVAEKNGIILIQNLQHADTIDAFARRGKFSVIILNTVRTSASRWIFDVAHEIGHFVLHTGTVTGSEETEAQANYFAGALLLPRKTFGREFKSRPFSWTHLFELKRRWSTSVNAMIRRAYQLKLVDPITYRRSYQYMSGQGWLKREPQEPMFAGPEWLPSAFAIAEKRFKLTPQVLCERLQMTPRMFLDVTGISPEVFEPLAFKPRLVGTN